MRIWREKIKEPVLKIFDLIKYYPATANVKHDKWGKKIPIKKNQSNLILWFSEKLMFIIEKSYINEKIDF